MREKERLVSPILIKEGLDQIERRVSDIIYEEVCYNEVTDVRILSRKITKEIDKLVQGFLEAAEEGHKEREKEKETRQLKII